MTELEREMEKAVRDLPFKPIFEFEGREIQLVVLLAKSPPLEAYWWKGKQVHILGVDVDGNFFLRHPDGGVRYWEHASKKETVVSSSERNFVSLLREDVNERLHWWKNKSGDDRT